MVDYKYKDLFLKSHIDKQLKIAADDGSFTATNSDIHFEDFELAESLCSDSELRFGSCEASMVKFQIRNAFIPLAGKWLTVTETLEGNTDAPFQYGRYKVFSDVPTADKEYRDIVAYDAMYDILGADVAAWYNSVLPDNESKITLKEFRQSFLRHFGLEEVAPENGLINDGMIVEKTFGIIASEEVRSGARDKSVIGETLSGKDVITAICEINGCFGHIGRDGKFHYIYLPQAIEGLYPANDLYPKNDLYPRDPKGVRLGSGTYKDIKWQDFSAKEITKLQIRQEENDIGKIWPETPLTSADNCYIIQGNFLVYGKSSEQLSAIAQNVFGKISGITYVPLEACNAAGNPCLEVGDPIRMSTKHALIETYVLERTLRGIQNLNDTYRSNGTEKYAEKVNGVHASIQQIKGKANILERTIEETNLKMIDMGSGLSTEIKVTAAGIKAEVAQTYETKTNASSEYTSIKNSITVEAGRISSEITRAKKAESNISNELATKTSELNSKIEQTESSISLSVETKIQETKTYASTQATNAQNAANAATDNKLKSYSTTTQMNAAIKIATDSINLSVDKKITETKEYADDAVATVDGKLANYSTTTQMNAAINLSAEGITATVSKTYETKTDASKEYKTIKSSVQQNAESITAEVTRASNAEGTLSTRITATEEGLSSKVTKGNISSEISQEAGQITISANRFVLNSTNCSIAKDGTITAKDVNITGKIVATAGGAIGGFTIGDSSIYKDKSSIISYAKGVYIGTDGIAVGYGGSNSPGANFVVTADGKILIGYDSAIEVNGYIKFLNVSNGIQFNSQRKISFDTFHTVFDDDINFNQASSYIKSQRNNSIKLESLRTTILSAYAVLGKNGGNIGFFGDDGAAKKTVAKASTLSSVTASSVATTVNNLIDALKAYNLIG